MSVIIKGMQMPKEGLSVVVDLWNNGTAYVYGTGNAEMYDAVELPDHGDLIDRDALIEEAKILGTVTCHQPFDFPYGCNLVEWCKLAKTVIPAERSEDETD